jgi:hypothetical protein
VNRRRSGFARLNRCRRGAPAASSIPAAFERLLPRVAYSHFRPGEVRQFVEADAAKPSLVSGVWWLRPAICHPMQRSSLPRHWPSLALALLLVAPSMAFNAVDAGPGNAVASLWPVGDEVTAPVTARLEANQQRLNQRGAARVGAAFSGDQHRAFVLPPWQVALKGQATSGRTRVMPL